MSNLFQKLELEAFRAGITPRTSESREWFRRRAARLTRINREQLLRAGDRGSAAPKVPGKMYMFFYDPKTKDKLPYYDKFPLIFIVGKAEGGFYGLNLHYLPPILRLRMLDGLLNYVGDKDYDDNTRIRMSYAMLQRTAKLRYYRPCFKHYLTAHVKSQFSEVPPPEWEIATFLPTAQWAKGGASKVYADSRRMLR